MLILDEKIEELKELYSKLDDILADNQDLLNNNSTKAYENLLDKIYLHINVLKGK